MKTLDAGKIMIKISMGKRMERLWQGMLYLIMTGYFLVFAGSCRQASSAEWIPDPDAVLNVFQVWFNRIVAGIFIVVGAYFMYRFVAQLIV
ncbi:MAG: hypothetical protein WAW07_09555 [Bacteroidales bacterium]